MLKLLFVVCALLFLTAIVAQGVFAWNHPELTDRALWQTYPWFYVGTTAAQLLAGVGAAVAVLRDKD